MNFGTRHFHSLLLAVVLAGWCVYACAAATPDQLLAEMYRFDISCTGSKADPEKKVCSQQRKRAYLEFLKEYSGKDILEKVQAEGKKSKERMKTLEKIEGLKDIPEKQLERIDSLAEKVQAGDTAAATEIENIGPDALPAMLALSREHGPEASKLARELIPVLERQLDERLDPVFSGSGAAEISAPARDAAVMREERYQRVMKRLALALEGPERPKPPAMVYAYMFGLGFIPFLVGMIASVASLGRFDVKTFALLMACYLAYAGVYAFFMFVAPYT